MSHRIEPGAVGSSASPPAAGSWLGSARRWLRPLTRAYRSSWLYPQVERLMLFGRVKLHSPPRIVIGSSGFGQPGWLNTDLVALNLLREDDWRRYFAAGGIAAILAEHVWEHLTPADGLEAASRCHRYLRSGGYLRIAVPDGLNPDPAYHDAVRPNGSGSGADDHKILYTYQSLGAMLEQAGFKVRLLEYFDEAGVFHALDWDPADGMIRRSQRFDPRNAGGKLGYTSLIIDAVRP